MLARRVFCTSASSHRGGVAGANRYQAAAATAITPPPSQAQRGPGKALLSATWRICRSYSSSLRCISASISASAWRRVALPAKAASVTDSSPMAARSSSDTMCSSTSQNSASPSEVQGSAVASPSRWRAASWWSWRMTPSVSRRSSNGVETMAMGARRRAA